MDINFLKLPYIALVLILSYTNLNSAELNYCHNANLIVSSPDVNNGSNRLLVGKITNSEIFFGKKSFINFETAVSISLLSQNKSIEMSGKNFVSPGIFRLSIYDERFEKTITWKLQILNRHLEIVDKVSGTGTAPEKIYWLKDPSNNKVKADKSYFYSLTLKTNSLTLTTAPKPLIINAVAEIKHQIEVSKFSSYKTFLKNHSAKTFLENLAKEINEHKEEKINLVTYTQQKNPGLCKNLLRLRNYLVINENIPIDRFNIFCDFVSKENKNTKFLNISGTKPTQTVSLLSYKEHSNSRLYINDSNAHLDKTGIFYIQNKKNEAEIELLSASGLKLKFKTPSDSNYITTLNLGINKTSNNNIILHEGPKDIYCENPEERKLSLKFGLGSHFISDSFSPKHFHAPIFNLSVSGKEFKFLSFLKNLAVNPDRINFELKYTLIPVKPAIGPSSSRQTMHDFNALMGYTLGIKHLIINFHLGYFLYISQDSYFKSRELNRLIYSGILGLNIKPRRLLFGKIFVEDKLLAAPALRKDFSSYRLINSLSIGYPLRRKKLIYIEYLKNIFRYKNIARKKYYTEGLDAVFLGLKVEI